YELYQSIDLTTANAAIISFYAKWAIESNYDYCQFQVSTNSGRAWIGQCALHTVEETNANGSVQPNGEPVWEGGSDWTYEEVDLSDYLGEVINVRFRFESDGGATEDGFYFDDFKIFTNNPLELKEDHFEVMAIPNPANNQFIVSTTKIITGGSIHVYDQAGKLVIHQLITEASNRIVVNTQLLSEGAYTVHVIGNDGFGKPAKLIVIH
ncbi:MAG: immune inhibitor A, partial [Crocinitomicaceae bacterium]|nr:immune inhibitor A [Crocinitomicaceae bacterium]